MSAQPLLVGPAATIPRTTRRRSSFGQRGLPGEYFTSPEILRREHERIFRRSWLLAGHVSDLPDSGCFFLLDIDRESVIVLRDADGELRAFHNVCRHRGSRLCLESQGQLDRVIRCPYHAWAYGLDGGLRAAPTMNDVAGFDRADHSLWPVELAVWHGLLFIHLEPEPVPLAEAFAPLDHRFAGRHLSGLRSAHRQVYEVEANWKLAFHNYSECYHCPTVHPHLNELTPFRNTDNDLDEGPVLGGPMWMENPDGSMTVGGERCAPPLPGAAAETRGQVYYYTVFPNAFLSLHPDYLLLHRLTPLAVDRTRIVCDWLFHPDAIDSPGFDPSPAVEFWDLTNRQDWTLCANAQLGVASHAWKPGPYSELESQLAAFDRHYLESIDAEEPAARRLSGSEPTR